MCSEYIYRELLIVCRCACGRLSVTASAHHGRCQSPQVQAKPSFPNDSCDACSTRIREYSGSCLQKCYVRACRHHRMCVGLGWKAKMSVHWGEVVTVIGYEISRPRGRRGTRGVLLILLIMSTHRQPSNVLWAESWPQSGTDNQLILISAMIHSWRLRHIPAPGRRE